MSGGIVISAENKEAGEILEKWKEKELSESFRLFLFNFILNKTGIKALQLEDDLNLPYHLPMPSLKKQEKD